MRARLSACTLLETPIMIKALLLVPLAVAGGLSGCVAYTPYGYPAYGYGYGGGEYRYAEPGVYVQPRPVYPAPRYRGGRRDRDRDGIPDRYDRDRDGDGAGNRYDRRPWDPGRR
jgi:hypothetical protein